MKARIYTFVWRNNFPGKQSPWSRARPPRNLFSRSAVKAQAGKIAPLKLAYLSGYYSGARHYRVGDALLAARQSFHRQFSAARDDPILGARDIIAPIINPTVRELDYKLGRSCARPQIGRSDFRKDLNYDCTLFALRVFEDALADLLINARRTARRVVYQA